MHKKLTQEDFIQRSLKKHGEKYDYSLVEYISTKKKVKIICNEHGIFEQRAGHHLKGQGCPICTDRLKFSTEIFIKKAIEIHNGKYDYSLVEYFSSREKIKIICSIHGIFEQRPDSHLEGRGCRNCQINNQGSATRLSTQEFIDRAKIVHGDKYDYSLANYTIMQNKVEIICSKHGSFFQTPLNHIINKNDCPNCGSSISKVETQWLDSLSIKKENRNQNLIINSRNFKVDALVDNTVYEFYGDYWHGNPEVFPSDKLNIRKNITFGELYHKTLEREKVIKDAGYNIISIWEKDFIESLR